MHTSNSLSLHTDHPTAIPRTLNTAQGNASATETVDPTQTSEVSGGTNAHTQTSDQVLGGTTFTSVHQNSGGTTSFHLPAQTFEVSGGTSNAASTYSHDDPTQTFEASGGTAASTSFDHPTEVSSSISTPSHLTFTSPTVTDSNFNRNGRSSHIDSRLTLIIGLVAGISLVFSIAVLLVVINYCWYRKRQRVQHKRRRNHTGLSKQVPIMWFMS